MPEETNDNPCPHREIFCGEGRCLIDEDEGDAYKCPDCQSLICLKSVDYCCDGCGGDECACKAFQERQQRNYPSDADPPEAAAAEPDKNDADLASSLMQDLNVALQVLVDKNKAAEQDTNAALERVTFVECENVRLESSLRRAAEDQAAEQGRRVALERENELLKNRLLLLERSIYQAIAQSKGDQTESQGSVRGADGKVSAKRMR